MSLGIAGDLAIAIDVSVTAQIFATNAAVGRERRIAGMEISRLGTGSDAVFDIETGDRFVLFQGRGRRSI
jgi:hypothetical protein